MDEDVWEAGKADELPEGGMKEVRWGEKKILLARVEGEIYAVGALCPHYKAPLVKGALCGTRLYCPWHHSSFDIKTGNLCEPPALDGLPRFDVHLRDGSIYLSEPGMDTEAAKEKMNIKANETFVIAGAGAAALMAAETLRSQHFGGRLLMITGEAEPPYDRTALSKNFMSGKTDDQKLPLRNEAFYQQHNIELVTDKKITELDAAAKTIRFADGSSVTYNKALVATGGIPNELKWEGAELENVCMLRSETDAKGILQKAKASQQVCIIGASFIGMETAASLTTLGAKVTVIAREKLPFEKNFGAEIGRLFYDLHNSKGVTIITGAEVSKIDGNGRATAVVLSNGSSIETDLVVVGIGVHPATAFLRNITLYERDKSVRVNEKLQAADGLFAAGDIARFSGTQWGESVRIEHWRVAQQHGRIAALNMLGGNASVMDAIPFFWTNHFNTRLSYVGHAESWDTIEYDGNVAEPSFHAFYVKEGKVRAVASMNRDVESNRIEDLMRTRGLLSVSDLRRAIGIKENNASAS